MTVTNTTNTVETAGDGATVAFTFDFKAQATTDIQVYKVNTTTLVATLQTVTTDYTIALNSVTEGGTVTYVVAPTTSQNSFIKRVMTIDQQTAVPTEGNIPETSLNNEYDKSRMIDIQLQEQLDRSVHFAETSSLSDVEAPEGLTAAARALKIWGWSADGLSLTLYAATAIDAVSVIAAEGDLVQGSTTGVAEVLSIGSTNDVLQVVSGKAAWVTNLLPLHHLSLMEHFLVPH